MFAASKCGFHAIPLEGEFDQLPELPLPGIVMFQNSQYQVLFEVDAESALTGDTATGRIRRLSRDEFRERWTGEAFQVQPTDELGAARDTLLRLNNHWLTFAGALGSGPFAAPRLSFVVAAAVCVSSFLWAPPLALLTGLCVLVSLWMAA